MSSQPKLPTTLVNTITSHTAPINAITFSSLGGTYILTGSSDRQIHLSRTEPTNPEKQTSPTTPIQKYAAHGYPVLDIAVSHDNQTFASVGGDRSVFVWDVQNSTTNNSGTTTQRRLGSNTSAGHTRRITSVAYAGESDSVIVSGSDDRSVRLWDLRSRDPKPLMVLEEAKDGISCLVVTPSNGHEIISGSVDGRVRSYDIRTGKVTVDVAPGAVTSLDLTRDGNAMLVGCLDGKIRLMDRLDGGCLRAFPRSGQESAGGDVGYENKSLRLKSCLAVNEALVLSGSESDGKVRAWDVLTGNHVGSMELNSPGKVVSVVKWRQGSQASGRQGLWAAGGVEGVLKIYGGG